MKEEGLETLLLLNLDRIFPGYGMKPCAKSLNEWEGADVEADDLAGCRHVFEVKYGAPMVHVVDQALAYALDVIAQDKITHFGEGEPDGEALTIACRMAGFWSFVRVDKDVERDHALAPVPRLRKVIEDTLAMSAEATTLNATDLETCAREHLDRLSSTGDRPGGRLRRLDFHVVIPGAGRGAEALKHEDLGALARMGYRNHQACIWEVAVELDRKTCTGRLFWREFWIAPQAPNRNKSKALVPYSPRITEFLCRMCAVEPTLRDGPRWRLSRDNRAWFEKEGDTSERSVTVRVDLNPTTLVIEAEGRISKHERQSGKWQVKDDPRASFLPNWIHRHVPEVDTEHTAKTIKRGSKEWAGSMAGTSNHALAYHSGTGQTARITLPLQGNDIDGIALGAARSIRDLIDQYSNIAAELHS